MSQSSARIRCGGAPGRISSASSSHSSQLKFFGVSEICPVLRAHHNWFGINLFTCRCDIVGENVRCFTASSPPNTQQRCLYIRHLHTVDSSDCWYSHRGARFRSCPYAVVLISFSLFLLFVIICTSYFLWKKQPRSLLKHRSALPEVWEGKLAI